MQTPYDIVIIGSGPAGLSFACSMLELGIKVLLIERSILNLFQIQKKMVERLH